MLGCGWLIAYDLDAIAYLGKRLCQFLAVGLGGVVGDDNKLIFQISLNLLYTRFEADVFFDFLFAVLTVHLRGGGHGQHAQVFASEGNEHCANNDENLFHCIDCFLFTN